LETLEGLRYIVIFTMVVDEGLLIVSIICIERLYVLLWGSLVDERYFSVEFRGIAPRDAHVH